MGVASVTVKKYECDLCHKEIGVDDWFRAGEVMLWQDRDVCARAIVSLLVEIDYSTPPNVCCKACAVKVLRQLTDKLEREVNLSE